MRSPAKKNRGDKIFAADWNLLIEAIEARTPRPGAGLELIASSGGFAYSKPPQALPNLAYPPFAVIAIAKNGTSFKVTINDGWVIERQPESDITPAVKFWMPTYGGTALDTVPRPQLTMNTGDIAWCKIETNTKGVIKTTPTILINAADQNGTHYNPVDPDASGTDGTHYVKLFKLVNDGGTPAIKSYQRSDIEHYAQLWTGENIGSGARVFKEYAETQNAYKFRCLKAKDYGGIKITENGDDIEFESDGWWGTITLDYTAAGASPVQWEFVIKGGRLFSVMAPGGASPGTEETPGIVDIPIVDTDT